MCGIPRQQFFLWLVFRNSLKTRDLLVNRGMIIDTTCLLCGNACESIQHIFSECPVSTVVWKDVLIQLGVQHFPMMWNAEKRWFLRRAKQRNMRSARIKRVMTAAIYNIWQD